MADTQRQPPADRVSSTLTTPASPQLASPKVDSADAMQAASPASDATVVRTVPRPLPMTSPMEVLPMNGQPMSGTAILSTNDSRMPFRETPGPALPPVMARSDPIFSVVMYANMWRNKYPHYYHRFFPDKPWSIHDLWDAADIHIERPDFLQEVLGFITRDNAFRTSGYASEWSIKNPEKLETIGAQTLDAAYDSNNAVAIVNKIFTDGETNEYPPEFLWHALYRMRVAMRNVSVQRAAAGTDSNDSGNARQSMIGDASIIHPSTSNHETSIKPSRALMSYPDHTHTSPVVPPIASASVMSPRPGPPIGMMPYNPVPPQNVYSNHSGGHPFGVTMSMAPARQNGPLQNPKNQFNRSTSGSGPGAYNQLSQGFGFVDNGRVPSDQHFRQSRHPSSMSTGRGPINHMSHMNHMSQVPHALQAIPITSPNMTPTMTAAQMSYQAIMQHVAMPPQSAPFGPHAMDAPFVDMTNNTQYVANRVMDRGTINRRGTMTNQAALYNPYGSDRPDKAADFTQIPNYKKNNRGNFPNASNRPRKYSNNSYGHRYDSTGSGREEMMRPSGGYYPDRFHFGAVNEEVVNDEEGGCDANRIGPKNEYVRKLYVSNLPDNVSDAELLEVFRTKANATRVDRKSSPGSDIITHAFVHFETSADARLCLSPNKFELRCRTLAVSVPHCYYKLPSDMNQPQFHGSFSQGVGRSNTAAVIAPGSREPSEKFRYSPQDARSDLPRQTRQPQENDPTAQGSPQRRKKKALPSPTKQIKSKSGEEDTDEEVPATANKLEAAEKQQGAVEVTTHIVEEISHQSSTRSTSNDQGLPTAVPSTPQKEISTESSTDLSPIIEKPVAEGTNNNLGASVSSPPGQVKNEVDAAPSAPTPLTVEEVISAMARPRNTTAFPPSATVTNADGTMKDTHAGGEQTGSGATSTGKDSRAQDESPSDPSDDDQKNDLSFHSAQEAQEESITDTHKTNAAFTSSTNALPEITSRQADSEPSDATSKAAETENTVSELTQPNSQASRKPGAKQTQSLNPFAKPSKHQQKKERQAKKKEKKKAKTEKGVTTPTKLGMTPTGTNNSEPDKAKVDATTGDLMLKSKSGGTPTQTQSNVGDSIEEIQAQQASVPQLAKHTNLDGDEPGSIPQATSGSKDPLPSTVVSSGALLDEASIGKLEHDQQPQAVSKPEVEAVQEASKKKASNRLQIAVPKLDLLKRKDSPPPQSSPTKSGSLGTTSPIGTTHHDSEKSSHVQAQVTAQDTVSVTSSPTLRAMSPKSMPGTATTEFFTPMPTPTATAPPNNPPLPNSEVAKKKKKKSKKKRTQAPADMEVTPAQSMDTLAKEPFHKQLSQIAEIQSKSASAAVSQDQGTAKDKRDTKLPGTLLGSINAYVKEKKDAYKGLQKGGWGAPRTPTNFGNEFDTMKKVHREFVNDIMEHDVDKAGKNSIFGRP